MFSTGKLLSFIYLPDDELDDLSKGILSYSSRLAKKLQIDWGVITAVQPSKQQLDSFSIYGVQHIHVLNDGSNLLDTPALLAQSIGELVKSEAASVCLFAHNDFGITAAPVVAINLAAAIMTQVISVKSVNSVVTLSKKVLGQRIAEEKHWHRNSRLVMTVPVRNLSQVLLADAKPATPKITSFTTTIDPWLKAVKITERIAADPQTVDLVDADVIFSAGKGCTKKSFEQLQELCRLLNVSSGVTRPVWDMGWAGFERMVGQTGRTVAPRLYLALGISGSMHHIGGIKDSRRLVAINNDAKAPIFPNTDEGFVADLNELLPKLLERVKKEMGGAK